MTEKEKRTHIDLIFENITDFKLVNISEHLLEEIDTKTVIGSELFTAKQTEIKTFGINHSLFKPISSGEWFELTPKGEELKLSKLTYSKFLKSKKKPILTNFEYLSVIAFILTFSYGYYQNDKSNQLKNQQTDFGNVLDSLKSEVYQLKMNVDSLSVQLYRKIESEQPKKLLK
jgi:hypothetical protein